MRLNDNLFLMLSGFLLNLPSLFLVYSFDFSGLSIFYIISLSLVLVSAFLNKRWLITRLEALIFLIFIALYSLSVFSGPIHDFVFYKFTFFLIKCVSLFVLGALVAQNYGNPSFERFLKGYFISLGLVCFNYYAYAIFNFLNNPILSVNNRLEIGEANPIWISREVLEFLIIYFFIYKRNLLFSITSSFLTFVVVVVSGSKGPILSFLVTVFISLKFRAKILFIFLSFLTAGFTYFIAWNYLPDNFSDFIVQRFFRVVPEGASQHFVDESRNVVWAKTILASFSDFKIFFLGEGVGQSFKLLGYSEVRYYPHNLILEILYENGFLVLASFVVLLLKAFSVKSKISLLLIFHFLNSLFSGDILMNEKLFLFLGMSIFISSRITSYEQQSKKSNA
ncbi:O-antigen ligase family protein [Alishewanella sp. HH-ZS]|uniref:O-antigen ligase family protein n=1 Tax=Alishewanella sp. HH-ZS TaxID=1856684 RepID=UPI0008235C20|nr:O-antigen ligase family protein [Alishewanella sp. HH-ZS]OCW96325.1 hypothetical protein A9165_12225 [Alishewanella sp. HH-ZS]